MIQIKKTPLNRDKGLLFVELRDLKKEDESDQEVNWLPFQGILLWIEIKFCNRTINEVLIVWFYGHRKVLIFFFVTPERFFFFSNFVLLFLTVFLLSHYAEKGFDLHMICFFMNGPKTVSESLLPPPLPRFCRNYL